MPVGLLMRRRPPRMQRETVVLHEAEESHQPHRKQQHHHHAQPELRHGIKQHGERRHRAIAGRSRPGWFLVAAVVHLVVVQQLGRGGTCRACCQLISSTESR